MHLEVVARGSWVLLRTWSIIFQPVCVLVGYVVSKCDIFSSFAAKETVLQDASIPKSLDQGAFAPYGYWSCPCVSLACPVSDMRLPDLGVSLWSLRGDLRCSRELPPYSTVGRLVGLIQK